MDFYCKDGNEEEKDRGGLHLSLQDTFSSVLSPGAGPRFQVSSGSSDISRLKSSACEIQQ